MRPERSEHLQGAPFPDSFGLDVTALQRLVMAGRHPLAARGRGEPGCVRELHEAVRERGIHLDPQPATRQPGAGTVHRKGAEEKLTTNWRTPR